MSRNVEAYWSFRADREGRAVVLPDGRCDLIFRYNLEDDEPPVPIITGPATEAYTIQYAAGACWQGLRLRPDCGVWLWRDRIGEARNNVLRGEAAYDHLPRLREVGHRRVLMDGDPGLGRRIEGAAPDRRLCEAVALIHVSGGRMRLTALAGILGCSSRHLNRLFRDNVGMAAKTYAQLVQFHRALALLRQEHLPLTDVALEAGYADHAHMTRAMRRFGRFAPSDLPRDLVQPGTLTSYVRFVQELRPGAC